MVAWLFPGQGSQYVGMTREWCAASPAAKQALAEASDVLGMDVPRLVLEGPAETLADTYNQQPAVLAASVAILRAAAERLPAARLVAGHSLGEYTALVAAGALSYAEALCLVRERGRLMKLAGQREPGGMAAVLGLEDQAVESVCAEVGGVQVANYNSPGQVVISGSRAAIDQALERLAALGAKRIVPLPITIAAHSALMSSASAEFRTALARAPIADAQVPVVANVTARPISSAADVRRELGDQLTSSVRWSDSVAAMLQAGVTSFWEIGPGTVLAGLVKRILKGAPTASATVVSLEKPG